MTLLFKGISDTGLVREVNQDSIFADEKYGCGIFLVADGMGGHSRGELASGFAVDVLKHWWRRNYTLIFKAENTDMKNMLEQLVDDMNQRIYDTYSAMNMQGGTTVSILLVNEKYYGIATVGDSRIYRLRDKMFTQISVDDVWENLPENVDLEEETVVSDARYGTLTQAMGYDETVRPRIQTDIIESDTVFFICSDGVYKFLTDKQIEKILIRAKKRKDLRKSVEKMKKEVYKNGAGDNLSGILVKIIV